MKGVSRRNAIRPADGRPRGAGWLAIVCRKNLRYRKQFGDSTHGGCEAAYGEAVAWRRETLRRIRLRLPVTENGNPDRRRVAA